MHRLERSSVPLHHVADPDVIIAHGCNAKGKMGSGVALDLRGKWPIIYDSYVAHLTTHPHPLGSVNLVPVDHGTFVANCITQLTYGRTGVHADPIAIGRCLALVVQVAKQCDLSVHIPIIGCGRGGLDWARDVEPIISDILIAHDYFIVVHTI